MAISALLSISYSILISFVLYLPLPFLLGHDQKMLDVMLIFSGNTCATVLGDQSVSVGE